MSKYVFARAHPTLCAYPKNETASALTLIADAVGNFEKPADKKTKFKLLEKGFLAGSFNSFAPTCPTCQACVPIRSNLTQFELSNSQKKLLKKSNFQFMGLASANIDPKITPHLHGIYKRYMGKRHNGSLDTMKRWTLQEFKDWIHTSSVILLAIDPKANAVAGFTLLDRYKTSLNGEYTVFDPKYAKHSPGKQLWLETMRRGKEQGLTHIYLGSWVQDSPKMDYKKNFPALETVNDNGEWVPFNPENHSTFPHFKKMLKAEGFSV